MPPAGKHDDLLSQLLLSDQYKEYRVEPRHRCPWPGQHADYIEYHDHEWGRPCHDSRKLLEKLCLEGQQAGLSWLVVLRKRARYRQCFHDFDPQKVACMTDAELDRLVQDRGLIRHRGKLEAVRSNAQAYLRLQQQGVDFSAWLWGFVGGQPRINRFADMREVPTQTPESAAMSRALKKAGFAFVGPTGCYAFMQSMGMVNDHLTGCFLHPDHASASAGQSQ
ncbi:DNA-3-methyladenine glycosylase I [Thiopseudomonas denitrificans]|uniref:DNA-3-methyladenine glycosylase I n=1 Tax=Thiopseudomonas denitrificans TaxID=1501432 RepID=A0A4R6U043_9GAMM|nr:DNA-3-methyladenine glycosylase I [Thiopseudomonas denitrificans]